MKVLIIIKSYPFPARSGDSLFTSALIRHLEKARDVELTVYCCCPPEEAMHSAGQSQWYFGRRKSNRSANLIALVSDRPRASIQTMNLVERTQLTDMIRNGDFDKVIFNESCTSIFWGQNGDVASGNRTELVYVSHNVDSDIRQRIALARKNPIARWPQILDARKYRKLETKLLSRVHRVTAMSEADRDQYTNDFSHTNVRLMKPAYDGPALASRNIGPDVPAVAALVGSFHWNAKQTNLRSILDAHAAFVQTCATTIPFRLRVAGSMPDHFAAYVRSKYPHVEILNGFDSLETLLRDVRVGLVLEELGGGFKLKTLDYVFHRVPILGFADAMQGSGLVADVHYFSADSYSGAMARLSSIINQFNRLNEVQNLAFEISRGRFNWSDRVQDLIT